MPRLYLSAPSITNNQITISGDKARYLTSVLRCNEGDPLVIFDGEGRCFRSVILKSGKKEVVAEVVEEFACDLESPQRIVLVQGLLKGEKMDLVVQKATELGVKEIAPVITERSQLRETRRTARWRKIAEEASRQSGRSVVPAIHHPVESSRFFAADASRPADHGFIFYEEGGEKLSVAYSSFISRPSSLVLAVGPEGGLTKAEVDLAKEKGLLTVSLGRRILRAETAAISAVTLVQFLLGDLG